MTILDSKQALKFRGFETKFEHEKKKTKKNVGFLKELLSKIL